MDEDGNIHVTGLSNTGSYSTEYTMIAYSPEGEQLWISRYAGPAGGENIAVDVAATKYGLVVVTVWSESEDNGLDIATVFYDTADGAKMR